MIEFDAATLDWEKGQGLIPAIVQDAKTQQVLMLGYMNAESLAKTLETGNVTFYSRSRQKLWRKGEESGNVLDVVSVQSDCDSDTLLIKANPKGPTCHRGFTSCFSEQGAEGVGFLAELEKVIADRAQNPSDDSYTSSLFRKGIARIAQKVGEEGVEVAIAAVSRDDKLTEEAADLLFHLLVLLKAANLSLDDALDVLIARRRNVTKKTS